jgi:hypothetical protein
MALMRAQAGRLARGSGHKVDFLLSAVHLSDER